MRWGEESIFNKFFGKLYVPIQKNENYLAQKVIQNVKSDALKLLEENIGNTL